MTVETNKIVLVNVDRHGATFAVNGENRSLAWTELSAAARQSDSGLAEVYAALRRDAVAALCRLPRQEQGLEVRVFSRTGGQTWIAEVYDAAGQHRGELMRRDEGMDEPHRHLAERTAREISTRIGAPVRVIPVV